MIGASISVVVPTWRRADYLINCLHGLGRQTIPPHEIVVVRREDDDETREALASWTDVRLVVVSVTEPGAVAAMAAGSERATGAIVAFTDDDAVPRPDWIELLLAHFADPAVGAAGGRDVMLSSEAQGRPLTEDVGRITRWGKQIGNHHLGRGAVRDVMTLKGVNMAFRRGALAFPSGLRGVGAQPHFEVAMCLWARQRGWRVVYDPSVLVDHFHGPRASEYHRDVPSRRAAEETAYNLVVAILTFEPDLFWRRACYGIVVGDREVPGVVRSAYAVLDRDFTTFRRLPAALLGQLRALASVGRFPVDMRDPGDLSACKRYGPVPSGNSTEAGVSPRFPCKRMPPEPRRGGNP